MFDPSSDIKVETIKFQQGEPGRIYKRSVTTNSPIDGKPVLEHRFDWNSKLTFIVEWTPDGGRIEDLAINEKVIIDKNNKIVKIVDNYEEPD